MKGRLYKLGGRALEDPELLAGLARELGGNPRAVVVHGGGGRVTHLLEQLGIESRFVNGRRATSPAAMEIVEMVLSGLTNKHLVAALNGYGVRAVGLSGRDGGMIRARLEPGLGCVGTPEAIDTALVEAVWATGWLPVVSPVSSGPGTEAVNVTADEAALGLARALESSSLVYLSDVDGVQIDGTLAPALDAEAAADAIASGAIHGGMKLKVDVALAAAAAGIEEVIVAGAARLRGGFQGTRVLRERES
jgi:acetylglutamate kinase